MEKRYEKRNGYVMAMHADGGQIWIGRSRDYDGGSFMFENAVSIADDLCPLAFVTPATPCVRVAGVRVFTNQLAEVVLWVDTEAAVDVASVSVNGTPGLLVVGADRLAILATCTEGNEPETVIL